MKKVKIIAGIAWALAGLILIIVLFPALSGFSSSVSKLPFMKLHPRYSGGEIAKQIITENYTLDIRKPVFKGLTGERKNGFVQLDWRGTLPEKLMDTIDYNLDGIPDFRVMIDTRIKASELNAFNNKVKNITVSTPTSYGWAIRVSLLR